MATFKSLSHDNLGSLWVNVDQVRHVHSARKDDGAECTVITFSDGKTLIVNGVASQLAMEFSR